MDEEHQAAGKDEIQENEHTYEYLKMIEGFNMLHNEIQEQKETIAKIKTRTGFLVAVWIINAVLVIFS